MSVVDHPTSATDTDLQRPSYAPIPASRRHPNTRKRFVAGLIAIAAIVMVGFGLRWTGMLDRVLGVEATESTIYVVHPVSLSITLTESGELKPVRSIDVKCEMDGRQNTILHIVDESTEVKKGDLLVEFASDQIREDILSEETNLSRIRSDLEAANEDLSIQLNKNTSDIEKAESDVRIAHLDLEKYTEGDLKQKRESVRLDIDQAKLDIEIKEDELARSEKLAVKKYVTDTKLKELRFDVVRAKAALEMYMLSQRILEEFEDPRDREQKKTALKQAEQESERVKKQAASRQKQAEAKVKDVRARVILGETKLERLTNELAHCKIFSPADGVAQYAGGEGGHWRDDDRIAAGVSVRKGQTLLHLPDTSQMMVITRIHEADRHMIQPGLPCIVKVPAVPGSSFQGRLIKISQYADSANRWMNPELKEHTAEVLLDATDAPVSPGDTAEITLLIDELKDVLAVPVISVYSRGAKSFVFVKKGLKARPVEIKVGQSNTTMVEVTEGLKAGDRVLRYADEALLAMLPKAEAEASTKTMPGAPGMSAMSGGSTHKSPAGNRAGAGRPGQGRMGQGRPGGEQKTGSGQPSDRGERRERGGGRPAGGGSGGRPAGGGGGGG